MLQWGNQKQMWKSHPKKKSESVSCCCSTKTGKLKCRKSVSQLKMMNDSTIGYDLTEKILNWGCSLSTGT